MAVLARALLAVAVLGACGGRSPLFGGTESDAGNSLGAERCDGLDDDGDGRVDEDFRDSQGRYLHAEHCGACRRRCTAPISNATEVGCGLVQGQPACVAEGCARGYGLNVHGGCTALNDRLCMPCLDDGDCGPLVGARCAEVAGEGRCTRGCGDGCPDGFTCLQRERCLPSSGSCRCAESREDFNFACEIAGPLASCAGLAECRGGVESACQVGEERCDEVDNDCDGRADEGFVDGLGSYSRDSAHCGACGVDCAADADSDAGIVLACGGDPFVPSCVTACPDRLDGVQVGDLLDADRQLENGCECEVLALRDESGPLAGGDALDVNCDGADGSVQASYYVAFGGDDSGPGSPTRPLRTIGEAVQRAAASLPTESPRPDVYVAAGVYAETVRLRDGVSLHGGYRGDFLSQGERFEVIVVAPVNTTAFGGAALVLDGVGRLPTLVEGLSLRGRDAELAGAPAIGVLVTRPGSSLILRNLQVRSGKPGSGNGGMPGAAASASSTPATDGSPQRAAIEDLLHNCQSINPNLVRGGTPGRNFCSGLNVSGGAGGSASCPTPTGRGPMGGSGAGGVDAPGGAGGAGGRDVTGPITGSSCPTAVCCGLADFFVPGNFVFAQAGASGSDGLGGSAGAACADPFGAFQLGSYVPGFAVAGSDGGAGGGGGGGGAGSGTQMQWMDTVCEFADGLGGGGGGGGAGGCGGSAGAPGASGGPSVGVLVQILGARARPAIEGVEITTQDGGRGGDGGAGGDGGQGGSGGFGGRLDDAARTTPSLAGPLPGERGGKGGDGGGGGAGGGGCGGMSAGIWVTGLAADAALVARYRDGNRFLLGSGGVSGKGGGGPMPASDGAAGSALDVVMR